MKELMKMIMKSLYSRIHKKLHEAPKYHYFAEPQFSNNYSEIMEEKKLLYGDELE